jgi:CheY-like chemotaxis protein
LDLNLPQKHGLEVLKWIRKSPRWATLPVLVLTSSNLELDVAAAYRLGANSFFVKPGDPEQLRKLITVITQYWFDSAIMPPVIAE